MRHPAFHARCGWLPCVFAASVSSLTFATRPIDQAPAPKAKPDESQEFFDNGVIPRFHIEVSAVEMEKLKKDVRAYVRATVRDGDTVYNDVGIHLKGGAGSFQGIDGKPALTLNFDKFAKHQKFHGIDKLHLNNSVQDGTYLSENICGSIFRDAGVPAPRCTNARVWLNGRDLGFFVLLEGFDTTFLRRHFSNWYGTVYDGAFGDIDANLKKISNDDRKPCEDLKALVAAINEKDPAMRRKRVTQLLDVDKFLTFMACEALTSHWDGYCNNRNNYRLYHDPATDRIVFMAHGMDQMFGDANYGLMVTNAMVARTLLESPEDRASYMERVAKLREQVFNPEVLAARVMKSSANILPVMREMSADAARDHEGQARGLVERIVNRAKGIDRLLGVQPQTLKFAVDGTATIKGWEAKQADGKTDLDQPEENGKKRLHIRCGDGGGAASWRVTVPLPQGKYRFEGQCRTAGVAAPDGPNTGAGLRISGGSRDKRLAGDTAWQKVEFEIEVTEPLREIVLVCELRASRGEAWFDIGTLKLIKK